jgi:two-component system chemotaxis response regulator CheB
MSEGKIRVLLADDSSTMRLALSHFLKQEPRVAVVGEARDGAEAVRLALELKPDVVSMDIRMPVLDGLEATRRIMATRPCRIVVVSSHSADAEVQNAFQAVQAGAVELFPKPSAGEDLAAWGTGLCRVMLKVGLAALHLSHPQAATRVIPKLEGLGRVDAFGIAASTGGPPALATLLAVLPPELPVPVLVAQHITEGFTQGLVRWLGQACKLKVVLAQAGELALPGTVYLAPDGRHLEVDAEGLFKLPAASTGVCPSGDRLLACMARTWGRKAAGAVLTGMGRDGAEGLLAVRQAGGATFAQDEASCVVFGMPAAARDLGAAHQLLPPEEIGRSIALLSRRTMTGAL